MVRCGRPAIFVWLGKLHTIEDHVLCHVTDVSINSIDLFRLSIEMSRLTRDGTAEPISRDQILRHARGQGNIIFPVQLTTSRTGNLTRLINTLLYVMTIHTYIYSKPRNLGVCTSLYSIGESV